MQARLGAKGIPVQNTQRREGGRYGSSDLGHHGFGLLLHWTCRKLMLRTSAQWTKGIVSVQPLN